MSKRQTSAVDAVKGSNGAILPLPERKPSSPRKMDVSQTTLDQLTQGRDSLLRQRQQLEQKMRELDAMILQQEGGIQLMQTLIAAAQA